MQKVKTLFIFTFMLVILYGAYVVLYKGPAPIADDGLIASDPDQNELELDLGVQVTANELLKGVNSEPPLVVTPDENAAAEAGQFTSPAAAALENPDAVTDFVPTPLVAQAVVNPTDVEPEVPTIGTPPNTTTTASLTDDAFPLAPDVNLDQVWNQGEQNIAGNLQPPDFSTTPEEQEPSFDPTIAQTPVFTRAWLAAQQQIQAGHLREALLALSVYYRSTDISAAQHQQLLPILDYLAGEVIYSQKHYMQPVYAVGLNETITTIAHDHRIPVPLLLNINGIASDATVTPGTEIKVVRGPFRAQVSLQENELTLFIGHLYAGRFSIDVANGQSTPVGTYTILDKQLDRIFSTQGGTIIPGGHGSNPFGHHWMDLGGNISIHGSAANAQVPAAGTGSIGMNPVDAHDVFSILSAGSQVTIQR
jgi:lipoprotein-anchoring transpeptidase ErfK/SrfK|tara:strand:+ start:2543 stop:3805 length:1263 start_codon:yes stop_codon:yes gene_type:complete